MFGRVGACCALVAASLTFPTAEPRRVLFIGNSLTLANGLGAMVEALARAAGDTPIEAHSVAIAGYSLEDHWHSGEARRILAGGRWTTVVLQQGPSTQPQSEVLLREYVGRFDREARRSGAQTAIFMAWPPRAGPGTFADSSRSYRHANDDVHGLLLPVGDAFRVAIETDPSVRLFGPDGFHPSPLGTYLAAIVIHRALSHRSEPFVPAGLADPKSGFPEIRTPETVVTLLKVAASVR
jgi:hypothetical protein